MLPTKMQERGRNLVESGMPLTRMTISAVSGFREASPIALLQMRGECLSARRWLLDLQAPDTTTISLSVFTSQVPGQPANCPFGKE